MTYKRKGLAPILTTIILLALTFTIALGDTMLNRRGVMLPMASATEELVKEVGDLVYFKAKVKNTGNQETGYIIIVLLGEHDSGEWETACIEDLWLEPEQYMLVELGGYECGEWMKGKYFDVQFQLYDHESETLLDSVTYISAFYVSEPIIAGAFIDSMIY